MAREPSAREIVVITPYLARTFAWTSSNRRPDCTISAVPATTGEPGFGRPRTSEPCTVTRGSCLSRLVLPLPIAVQNPTRPSLTGTTQVGVLTGTPDLRNVVNAMYFSSLTA